MTPPGSDVLTLAGQAGRRVRAASLRPALLASADIAAFVSATALALLLHLAVASGPLDLDARIAGGAAWHGWGTILVASVLLAYFGSRGHYTARIPFWTELNAVTGGIVIACLSDNAIRSGVYAEPFGFEAVTRWIIFLPCLLLLRQGARSFLRACGLWNLRTLIVGDGRAVALVRAALASEPALGYDVAGAVSLQRAASPLTGPAGVLREFGAEFVVLATGVHPSAESVLAASLERARVPFALMPALDGVPVAGITNHYFFSHDVMLLTCGNNMARPVCRLVKAAFDQAVAAFLLVLLSPLLLVLSALVRLDGGPALFGHGRIGEGGQRFRCLKFRTMTVDADAVLRDLLARDALARAEWSATQKLRTDPRITRIGRVLRQTSLDELPQLLNVLRGEMSLVGPRPIVDAEVFRYGDQIGFYYETKPGITGLWQVSGRSNTSYEHRVRLDVWYVRNWTLWHDVAILLKTIPAVLLKEGAH